MPRMTDAVRDAFLAGRRYGILSHLDDDGAPVAVPVWFGWDGRRVEMFTHVSLPKVRQLKREPRASVLVTNFPDEVEQWVRLEGDVTFKPGGLDVANRALDRYWPAGDPRRSAVETWAQTPDDWLLLELTPKAIRTYTEQTEGTP